MDLFTKREAVTMMIDRWRLSRSLQAHHDPVAGSASHLTVSSKASQNIAAWCACRMGMCTFDAVSIQRSYRSDHVVIDSVENWNENPVLAAKRPARTNEPTHSFVLLPTLSFVAGPATAPVQDAMLLADVSNSPLSVEVMPN